MWSIVLLENSLLAYRRIINKSLVLINNPNISHVISCALMTALVAHKKKKLYISYNHPQRFFLKQKLILFTLTINLMLKNSSLVSLLLCMSTKRRIKYLLRFFFALIYYFVFSVVPEEAIMPKYHLRLITMVAFWFLNLILLPLGDKFKFLMTSFKSLPSKSQVKSRVLRQSEVKSQVLVSSLKSSRLKSLNQTWWCKHMYWWHIYTHGFTHAQTEFIILH